MGVRASIMVGLRGTDYDRKDTPLYVLCQVEKVSPAGAAAELITHPLGEGTSKGRNISLFQRRRTSQASL